MSKPCEYCGVDLPLGVDKGTRRQRSFHFASCEKRPLAAPHSPDIEAQRDALLADAERYRWLALKAHKNAAYDIYGNGAHWSIGFVSDDSRHTLDAAIDAIKAAEEGKCL